jgi:hypothetical protein
MMLVLRGPGIARRSYPPGLHLDCHGPRGGPERSYPGLCHIVPGTYTLDPQSVEKALTDRTGMPIFWIAGASVCPAWH